MMKRKKKFLSIITLGLTFLLISSFDWSSDDDSSHTDHTLVCIRNNTSHNVYYKYNWGGDTWYETDLEPGQRQRHYVDGCDDQNYFNIVYDTHTSGEYIDYDSDQVYLDRWCASGNDCDLVKVASFDIDSHGHIVLYSAEWE